MVSPIKVRLFSVYPSRYITTKVPMIDRGIAAAGINVALARRKNANTTSTTSMNDNSIVN